MLCCPKNLLSLYGVIIFGANLSSNINNCNVFGMKNNFGFLGKLNKQNKPKENSG